ncbi:MAG: pilus assembly protein PilM [Oscillospiraceae bacterium]|nr:pilus assembly protein PilM [Oscillospiraceae bacterium]
MLSFDITDRHIRIVRGTEGRGRIRVSSASTIDLQEGLIVNGHIKDIPKMATIINDELKARRMDDKEAVVTLSSNLVIFKELAIPKAKTSTALLTMVTNQMQHTMGTGEDYSVAYSIAGETEQEGNTALKILATACPFEVVDSFRKVFQMLSISLKSVTVTCNAISRIILSDKKNLNKMPMLAVQVDPTFVSLNLYEDGQLTFSRFASIDAVDYDNSEDYVYEAVNENINRMIQFQRSRNADMPIQNVTFYGDTSEYIRLTNSLEDKGINTSLLGVPNNIAGYENIEFQDYANAIGAMFKSNKDTDRINLLETDASSGKTDVGSSFFISVLGAFVLSAAVVGAVWLGFNNAVNSDEKKIAEHDAWINSQETQDKLLEVDETQEKIDKVALFKTDLDNAVKNYESMPKFERALYEDLNSLFEENECAMGTFKFGSGLVEVELYGEGIDAIDNAVEALYTMDEKFNNPMYAFVNITYNGFEKVEPSTEEGAPALTSDWFKTEITMQMPANPVEEEEPAQAENGEEGVEE